MDIPNRALNIFMGKHYTIKSCHETCSKYRYFSLQNIYYCFCSNNSFGYITQYGLSNNCIYGLGGNYSNDIYENINGMLSVFIFHF